MSKFRLPIVVAVAVGMSGCAAPIKYFMEKERESLIPAVSDNATKVPISAPIAKAPINSGSVRSSDELAELRKELFERARAKASGSGKPSNGLVGQSPKEQFEANQAMRQALRRKRTAYSEAELAEAQGSPRPNAQELFKLALAKRTSQPLHGRADISASASFGKMVAAVQPQTPVQPDKQETSKPARDATVVPDRITPVPAVTAQQQSVQEPALPAQLVSFADNSVQLDASGEKELREFLNQRAPNTKHRIVIFGGLAGAGELFERMQVSTKRVDAVAAKAQSPMVVEKRFDPALKTDLVRVQIEVVQR